MTQMRHAPPSATVIRLSLHAASTPGARSCAFSSTINLLCHHHAGQVYETSNNQHPILTSPMRDAGIYTPQSIPRFSTPCASLCPQAYVPRSSRYVSLLVCGHRSMYALSAAMSSIRIFHRPRKDQGAEAMPPDPLHWGAEAIMKGPLRRSDFIDASRAPPDTTCFTVNE